MAATARPYRQRQPINLAALDQLETMHKATKGLGTQEVRVIGDGAQAFSDFLRALNSNAEVLLQSVREVETLRAKISHTAAKSTRRSKQLRQQNKTIEVLNGRNRSLAQQVYDSDVKHAEALRQAEDLAAEIRHLKLEMQKLRTAALQPVRPIIGSGRFA